MSKYLLVGLSLSALGWNGTTQVAGLPEPDARATAVMTPDGELRRRIDLSLDRLVHGTFPEFTRAFVLADVLLDPGYPRLYQEFSGDISGRYLEVMALMAGPEAVSRLEQWIQELLKCQRSDGRFGDADLVFTADQIGKPHMNLLWGNGRLLTGLMTWYQRHPNPEVLAAAARLGRFLSKAREHCSHPDVTKRLENRGASGLICFTQLIEGLVMLGHATHDQRYWDEAATIVPSLGSRGTQHSHGYLSTLRGILLLYQATRDARLLDLVETAYRDLVDSADYLSTGGVLEFFGAETKGLSQADLRKLWTLDNKDAQDEGCSEADWLRLSFQLWQITGKADYLVRGERCLLNHLYANQFYTGDFGHRVVFKNGFRPSEQTGMAWWCCTMHGLRAFKDVQDVIITRKGDTVSVNLFLDGTWSDGDVRLRLRESHSVSANTVDDGFQVQVERVPDEPFVLAVRQPDWSEPLEIKINQQPLNPSEKEAHYYRIRRRWKAGDRLDIAFDYRVRLETRDRVSLAVSELGAEAIEAVLFYGPYLMAVHEADDPLFFRRPWMFAGRNASIIRLPSAFSTARLEAGPLPTELASFCPIQCRFQYTHGGWPNTNQVTLRPMSRQTGLGQQQVLGLWLKYQKR
jgi:hypothetical protein